MSKEDNLSIRLRHLMQQHGNLSEAELARETKIPQPTIHRLLSGNTQDPRVSTLHDIAIYFNISLDYLLTKEPLLPQSGLTLRQPGNNRLLPIIDWLEVPTYLLDPAATLKSASHTVDWTSTELSVADNAYCLRSRPSMEPRFPRGTLLIVDVKESVEDGDFVIVHYLDEEQVTLRSMLIDGNMKMLQSIFDTALVEPFTDNKKILGIVVQSKLTYHQ